MVKKGPGLIKMLEDNGIPASLYIDKKNINIYTLINFVDIMISYIYLDLYKVDLDLLRRLNAYYEMGLSAFYL